MLEKVTPPVTWDANARQASIDAKAPGAVKPAEWAHLHTTQSGEFVLWLALPDGEMVKLTTATLKVPVGKIGVLSARLAACLGDEPVKEVAEVR